MKSLRQTFPLRLVCESVQVPENVGMIFRLAESFGVEHLYLSGLSIAPPNVKISKASRSTVRVVPYSIHPDTTELAATLKQEGFAIIGLEITDRSEDIRQYDFTKHEKIALVAGGEKFGISANVLPLLDACVHIRMFGKTGSLNVATALAIALHDMTGQIDEAISR